MDGAQIPEGVEFEQVWAIEAEFAPDGGRAGPVRLAHLARLARLMREGVVVAAGALGNVESAFIVVRVADEAAAREFAATDVYWTSGAWASIRVRRYGPSSSAPPDRSSRENDHHRHARTDGCSVRLNQLPESSRKRASTPYGRSAGSCRKVTPFATSASCVAGSRRYRGHRHRARPWRRGALTVSASSGLNIGGAG